VHRFTRHVRGLLVALATLALSAGVVLAARPTSVEAPPAAAADGLSVASEAAGKTVPVGAEQVTLPEVDEDADKDAPEVDEDADAKSDAAGERPENHGWFVSEAAKGAMPAAAVNHGQQVSEVARSDEGKPETATTAAERGASAAAAKAAKPAKGPKAGSH
jgi:hypothetical protein